MGKLTQILLSKAAVNWSGSCTPLCPPFAALLPGAGVERRVLARLFQKLLMGLSLHGVHHLLFDYKDPKFPLRMDYYCWRLVLCLLPAVGHRAGPGLKSHLSTGFGGSGEEGQSSYGSGEQCPMVTCCWARLTGLSVKVNSLWSKQWGFVTSRTEAAVFPMKPPHGGFGVV